ncbi:hypothetical protein HDU76_012223 [Blyttiomyces sp. JEL0837]|nr:hypothetical protein HDU76_012223 [Blyttiomyces sp. JEL0837]
MAAAAGGVEKVLVKLAKSVEDGNYYEAHQMYHSVCQRYLKQKKPQDAISLVYSGALNLLKYNQIGSAADLAERMLDIYNSESLPVDDVNKSRLIEIFTAFPVRDNTYVLDFVRSALRWSAKFGVCPTGDQQLHHVFGSRYFKEKEYYEAESHLLYGTLDSAKAAGHMAYEWSEEGYCTDKGYFIARIVLPLLAQKKMKKAKAAFDTYHKDLETKSPSDLLGNVPFRPQVPGTSEPPSEVPVFKHRLANFVSLLLIVVQRESADQFTAIKGEYRGSLDIDGYLHMLVDRIADVWFGLGPKKQPNIMEDLMKSLFAGPPPAGPGIRGPALSEID